MMNRFNYQKYPIFAAVQNGPVAEWLGSALQKLLQRFESARDLKGCQHWRPFFIVQCEPFYHSGG